MDNHRSARRLLVVAVFALGLAMLMLLPTQVARGAPSSLITVNTLADEDFGNPDCSLREAIIAANTDSSYNGCPTGSGADTIIFGLAGTIILSSTLPTISNTLTIHGHAEGTTISGNNSYRIFNITDGDFVPPGPIVNMSDLTIASGNGGGSGTGGIYARDAILSITNTLFISNAAPNNLGGALFSGLGIITVTSSAFSTNSAMDGGAISLSGTEFKISRSTFSGNSAIHFGGAIDSQGSLIIENSTIYSNTAGRGGALVNQSITTLRNITIYANTGITATGGVTNSTGTIIF
jgi:CSLREA domain-containing protein